MLAYNGANATETGEGAGRTDGFAPSLGSLFPTSDR